MSLNRLWLLLPGWRSLIMVLVSTAVGAALAIVVSHGFTTPDKPAPNPGPPHDQRFVTLGKAYLPQLGQAYSAAWEEGAKQLEAGKGVSLALDAVSKAWSANRTQLYDHVLTPEFSRIVAENVNDTDVTPTERAALAAAWRGLAFGMGK